MSSSYSRKRKNPPHDRDHAITTLTTNHTSQLGLNPSLFIQAHEADVLSGSQAFQLARSLAVEVLPSGEKHVGDALIRLNVGFVQRDRDENGKIVSEGGKHDVWVDRYDARLLLDALPSLPHETDPDDGRLSPAGWSDLPSDSEDTFFLTRDETEDYHREKRRKVLENLREERMRALREERDDDEAETRVEDTWGGSDEEPDDTQRELMRRTAAHLFSSPNPAQLEMRILANHGADPRFAFLKGRWSRTWRTAKARLKAEKEQEKAGALSGLAGYGDSDGDDEEEAAEAEAEEAEQPEDAQARAAGGGTLSGGGGDGEEETKAARRARAGEWAEKRRASILNDKT
ncbi:hypothetical protein EIP91_001865 [Steccherinum ochraceum]|uniref:Uncharacterized protein n=1 Tax=Steccherinum ochraceum TaxID=92696 RepID=A0A4V2MWF4_9APHY|nr:hypothetical protein EIP91_001865 [Steccherinum ochraceum]